jgi:hypothetical protein
MAGILDFELDKVPELTIAPEGEAKLSITTAEGKLDKNQQPGVQIRFRVANRPNTSPLSTWLSFPTEGDDEDQRNNKLRRIITFRDAFKLSFKTPSQFANMVEEGTLKGKEGWAILSVTESDEYGKQNSIKRFTVPKAK